MLLEYKQEGMGAEAVACHIKQRVPNLPVILVSAYSGMPERILWLADDCIMNFRSDWYRSSNERTDQCHPQRIVAAQAGGVSIFTAPLSWQSALCCSALSNNCDCKWGLSQGFAPFGAKK